MAMELILGVIYSHTPFQGWRRRCAPKFLELPPFMPTPFDAERPNYAW